MSLYFFSGSRNDWSPSFFFFFSRIKLQYYYIIFFTFVISVPLDYSLKEKPRLDDKLLSHPKIVDTQSYKNRPFTPITVKGLTPKKKVLIYYSIRLHRLSHIPYISHNLFTMKIKMVVITIYLKSHPSSSPKGREYWIYQYWRTGPVLDF